MRLYEILCESVGPHAVREISFRAKRSLAQHCVDISRNLGEPHGLQVIASIHNVGMVSAEVKMTLIGPTKPVQAIVGILQRGARDGGLRQFTVTDPDAVGG